MGIKITQILTKYQGKLGHELLKEHMRRRSECNIHMPRSFGLRIEEISETQRSIHDKNQEKHHQETGKDGAVLSCQDIKKRLLKIFLCIIRKFHDP
ncbi:hypothetical protein TNCV_1527711 [Trichonephila clavipes]|nr:hypothetical protein TNCV_1527711 [Trichonephila clavipes]